MSSDPSSFRCPVCRARQTRRDVCRRCGADLRLVVRAHRRVEFLIAQRHRALAEGDPMAERAIAAELELLAPKKDL